jgi:subtilisin family serine protease
MCRIAPWLVALSLAVLPAQAAPRSYAERFDKPLQGRLADPLNRAALAGERASSNALRQAAEQRMVTVVFEMAEGASARDLAGPVQKLGGKLLGEAPGLVKASVPTRALRVLAADRSVVRVREPFRPSRKEIVSAGVPAIRADSYVARTGADGAGVRVGILDGGFARVEEMIGRELPENTELLPSVADRVGSFDSVHGTACAEIVHDVAPGATLVLGTFADEVDWFRAVNEMVGAGVKVISHSVGFDNYFPADGRHPFAQTVNSLQSQGILFVTAAGNEAGNYYQGTWRDADNDQIMEAVPGVELIPILVAEDGAFLILRWDDLFGFSNHDYDLLVVTEDFLANPSLDPANPAIVALSADTQAGADGVPREALYVEGNGEVRLLYAAIVHDSASPLLATQKFWLYSEYGVHPDLAVASGTLSLPADAGGAVTVGAVNLAGLVLEGYSSRGPTVDGRVKPDLAAPDNVETAAYDGETFLGTSAATPHAAGAAALLLSRNRNLNLLQLRDQLEKATASGGLAAAKNNDVGYGVIDLSRAP